MTRSRRSAALVLAVSAAAAAPAAVAMTPNSINASPNPVHRGKLVRVFGTVQGCGGPVTLISRAFVHTHDFAGQPAVFATLRYGSYSVRVRVPARRRTGTYTITGRCGGGNIGVTRKLRVVR
jgi:hypothetical protein